MIKRLLAYMWRGCMLNAQEGIRQVQSQTNRPKWIGYLVALLVQVALAVALIALKPILPLGEYPVFFALSIIPVAYYFGEGPALLAFIVSLFIFDYYFIPPVDVFWPKGLTPEVWAMFAAYFIGTPVILLVVIRMRRAQRRVELLADELYESRERLARIMETVPSGILTIDTDGRVTFANAAAYKAIGLDDKDIIGAHYSDPSLWQFMSMNESHLADEELPFARVKRSNQILENQEYILKRPGVSRRIISINAAPLRSPEGEIVEVVESLADITEIVELREDIQSQLTLLQQALVPPAPSVIPGYNTAAVYLPAFPGQQIGGDLCDIFRTECGQLGVMIGDVSGKGVEAAALAAAARSTIHSFAYDLSSPGQAMLHANAVLASQESESGKFVTMFLAIIDPESGKLSYARAGHPPAVIRRANGDLEFLEEGNVPIGIFDMQQYEAYNGHLELGDKLILYTDGITEARRDSELFEMERVEQVLKANGHKLPDEVASSLLAAARDWAEGRLRDDVAILVVEREAN